MQLDKIEIGLVYKSHRNKGNDWTAKKMLTKALMGVEIYEVEIEIQKIKQLELASKV